MTGFKTVTAYGTAANNSVAVFSGSTENDTFYASNLGAQFFGTQSGATTPDFFYSIWGGFNTVTANAGTGSNVAHFHDYLAGQADTLTLGPTSGDYKGVAFENIANGFQLIHAFADGYNNSTAVINGSSAAENFIVTPNGAQLYRNGVKNVEAFWFKHTTVNSGGGADTANWWHLSSSGNTFQASPTSAIITGAGFDRTINNMSTVIAEGQTSDKAIFNGSSGADSLTADGTQVVLSGAGYTVETFPNRSFGQVSVYGKSGTDSALVDNAFIESGLTNELGSAYSKGLWLYDFSSLHTTAKPANPTPAVHAIDSVMSMYWQ